MEVRVIAIVPTGVVVMEVLSVLFDALIRGIVSC